jgi:hypothetical protein
MVLWSNVCNSRILRSYTQCLPERTCYTATTDTISEERDQVRDPSIWLHLPVDISRLLVLGNAEVRSQELDQGFTDLIELSPCAFSLPFLPSRKGIAEISPSTRGGVIRITGASLNFAFSLFPRVVSTLLICHILARYHPLVYRLPVSNPLF